MLRVCFIVAAVFAVFAVADDAMVPKNVTCWSQTESSNGTKTPFTTCTHQFCYHSNFTLTHANKSEWISVYGCTNKQELPYNGVMFAFPINRCEEFNADTTLGALDGYGNICNTRDNCTDTCAGERIGLALTTLLAACLYVLV